jgi:VCBS repeat-containing protein
MLGSSKRWLARLKGNKVLIARTMRSFVVGATCALCSLSMLQAQETRPLVAIHDSELTRALETIPAAAPTPSGPGTTGYEWWASDWHYFVLPESLAEALRSDGTAFTTVGDSNITAGILVTNGQPAYPIVISLASEAIRDDEIAPFTNYVASGGFLFVGSSAFTRNPSGTTRGDFAFANELGVHMVISNLVNWTHNNTLAKTNLPNHRLVSHIPTGQLTWRMPSSAEEIPWGVSPDHNFLAPHDLWQVQVSNATVLAQADAFPYLTIKPYGKGYFIYHAGFQPLVGHGGFAPGMYAYVIFRRAIEWAFESAKLPVPKLSPWPYQYDAAFMLRHDLENFTNEIASIETSAAFDYSNGAKGDYFFCTGTLRDDVTNATVANTMIAGLRRAVTNYGATIGPHNGGLKNPTNPSLVRGQFDYWHWGPDEALDVTPTNYPSGKAYALASISNSFTDVETWLSGITNGVRIWNACYFNGTRENSKDIQAQLNVKVTGEEKLGPFPHWALSAITSGKRYGFLTEPVSDWFVGGLVAQSLEPWHPPGVHTSQTMHDAVDFYYNLGGLVNVYSHTLSTGFGDAGQLVPDYITYSLNTNFHPRIWSANSLEVYQWWLQRSNAQITVTYGTNGSQSSTTFKIVGATDPNTAVEMVLPASGTAFGIQVLTNASLASGDAYRTNSKAIKICVGTTVTNAEVRYVLGTRAQDDSYSGPAGLTLAVPAPGVLQNDLPGVANSMQASLGSGPSRGSLTLNSNGSFVYTPSNNFLGIDSFTYTAIDNLSNASTATVTISMLPPGGLFADDFTRAVDPGSLSPWSVQSGNWLVSGGVLNGGTNSLLGYGITYLTDLWTNYAVEARIQFPAGVYGGGLDGRLNAATGARYAAWVYPEGSSGGSSVLRLFKFQDWTTFGYNGVQNAFMQQASLPSVGTNWHTLKLAFHGTQIAVYYDGTEMMSVTDIEAQPYRFGGIGADMWTDNAGYVRKLDDVVVKNLVVNDAFTINEDVALVVPAAGVLTNDTEVYGTNLTATLATQPAHGSVTLNSDGSFTYTPATNYNGPDIFIYQANDRQTNLGTAQVTITINPVNDAPVLPAQPDRTIAELATMLVTNTATDVDTPANNLSYVLTSSPSGSSIDNNGVISWTPTEAQGPSTNVFVTVVTDDGSPPLSATNSFTVVVTEVNSAPVLPIQPDRTIAELTALVVTNGATDSDIPANNLSYALFGPANASISMNGIITWTPAEAQGPSTNILTTVVTDDGSPPLSATNSFTVVVTEVNSAPVLPVQPNFTIAELTSLFVTNSATDSDLPANNLSYILLGPTNASISANGIIIWTPNEAQGPSTNIFTTMVTDDGLPPLSVTNSFTVVVTESNSAPVLPVQTNYTIAELTTFTVTNTASDSDIPANNLSYLLIGPSNAVISANGVISWAPGEAQGPSTNTFTTIVTDDGTPPFSATNSFIVVVTEVNSPPALPAQTDYTIAELTTLTVTNTAADPDIPANNLLYVLLGPTNATISTNGVVSWTPNEAQGPSTNTFITVVTDDGLPPLSATNSFTVVVTEVNSAPVLPLQTNYTVSELTTLTVTNTAVDSDIPANNLSYLLVGPSNAVISANGVITWTPTEDQGPSTNMFATVVTDDGVPPLSATNSFTVVVVEVNSAPVLPAQANYTIAELTSLTVTNTATDPNIPANNLSYVLIGPANANISSNGIISWTSTEAQGPSTNVFITIVTDDGTPPLSATNSFTVIVTEVNSAPVLPIQPNFTIAELATLFVTNTATDPDLPANNLSYLLLGPTNAGISTNGVISWTPTEAQGPSTNAFITVVTDDGVPPLSTTNTFTVVVTKVNSAPILPVQTNYTIAELTTLIVTNTAIDSDIPANNLSYLLLGPTNASISTNGIITWPPGEADGPSTNTFTTIVTDDGVPPLSSTNSFTVVVTEVNAAPILPIQTNYTIAELTILTVTNAASDSDLPLNNLSYALLDGPTNAVISSHGIITWTPTEAQGPGTNVFTTVVTDDGVPPLSATNSFTVVVTEVNSAPVLPVQPNYTIAPGATLVVTNAASDSDLPTNNLSYVLFGPANATISSNGIITWSPGIVIQQQGNPTNTFTTIVTDDGVPPLSATNVFAVVVVLSPNTAPVLPVQTNYTIAELSTLIVTNTATDQDIPANHLSYALLAPTNATISTNGIITWTPTEAQGPGTNTITTVVTDDGTPPLSATNSFTVVVTEVNTAPLLPAQTNYTIAELTTLIVTNAATDSDIPANNLSYALLVGPTNAIISTNGIITWTPTEAQGPSTNAFMTVVTDDGAPPLSATNTFLVVVTEVNSAPVLPAQANYTIAELTALTVTNAATDQDIPANNLSYSLIGPTNAIISTNGVISWTPTEAQGPSTNTFTTVVADDGVPPLSATNSFQVVVTEVNSAPVLPVPTNYTIEELTTLTVTNTATDSDLPANNLTYTLSVGPTNASISTNGVISWTSEAQGPSTNIFTTVVSDDGVPSLSATNSFTVVVTEVNSAPVLPVPTNYTIAELTALVVTNTATDSDLPANILTYTLLSGPTNAAISANGIITWIPTEAQGPGTNTFTTIATDNGSPPLSATNSFTVVVTEVNVAPVLPTQGNHTIAELTTLTLTNTATDADLPVNTLAYTLLVGPTNATISTNGVITWTPTHAQAPGTNVFTTVVSDNGTPSLSATNTFTVYVSQPPPPFLITSINATNGTATIKWNSVSGQSYRLQFKNALTEAAWHDVSPTITAIGTNTSTTNLVGNSPQRFYRVMLAQPDLIITSFKLTNNVAILTWDSVASKVYRVQYKTAVNNTNWLDVSPDITAVGPTSTGTNAVGNGSQRFYRVVLLP